MHGVTHLCVTATLHCGTQIPLLTDTTKPMAAITAWNASMSMTLLHVNLVTHVGRGAKGVNQAIANGLAETDPGSKTNYKLIHHVFGPQQQPPLALPSPQRSVSSPSRRPSMQSGAWSSHLSITSGTTDAAASQRTEPPPTPVAKTRELLLNDDELAARLQREEWLNDEELANLPPSQLRMVVQAMVRPLSSPALYCVHCGIVLTRACTMVAAWCVWVNAGCMCR